MSQAQASISRADGTAQRASSRSRCRGSQRHQLYQLGDIERICDRLLVLNDGQVLRDGTAEETIEDGQSLEDAMFGWGAA